MTTEYTPKDHETWARFVTGSVEIIRRRDGATLAEAEQTAFAEFNRWLAAHDARVRAEALREAVNYFETWVDVQELDEQTSLDGIHWVQVEEAWTLQGIFMEWFRNRADRIEQEAGA